MDGTAFGIIADNTWKQKLILTDSIRFVSEGPAFSVVVIERKTLQEVGMALTDLVGKIYMLHFGAWDTNNAVGHMNRIPGQKKLLTNS